MVTSPGSQNRPRRAPVIPIDSGGHRERVLARRDELVAQYAPMVLAIARKLHGRLPPCFELSDLVAEGNLALVRAATRFRPKEYPGVPFGAYAWPIVHGAMVNSFSDRNWRNATLEAMDDKVVEIRAAAVDAEARVDTQVLTRRVQAAIALLPAKQREVMVAKYSAEEPTNEVIGRRLGIGPSRACQLHGAALASLHKILQAAS